MGSTQQGVVKAAVIMLREIVERESPLSVKTIDEWLATKDPHGRSPMLVLGVKAREDTKAGIIRALVAECRLEKWAGGYRSVPLRGVEPGWHSRYRDS